MTEQEEAVLVIESFKRAGDRRATRGTLVVTNRQLTYRTTANNPSTNMQIDALTRIALDERGQELTIKTDDDELMLVGTRAPWVAARLAALRFVNANDLGLPVPEQPVFSGQAQAYVNDLVTARGEVRLTTWRLCFEPKAGADAKLWDRPTIDLPLHRITHLDYQGVKRILTVGGADELRIGGPLVPRLHAFLTAMGVGDDLTEGLWPGGPLYNWKVASSPGPIATPGVLLAALGGTLFTPSGRVDSAVGARPQRIVLDEITHLLLKTWPDRRLVLQTPTEEFVYSTTQAASRFQELAALLCALPAPQLPPTDALGQIDPHDALDLLEEWGEDLTGDGNEVLLLACPACHWLHDSAVRRGALVLTTHWLWFLPAAGPSGEEPALKVPTSVLSRSHSHTTRIPSDHIRAQTKAKVLRFQVFPGQNFVHRFWDSKNSWASDSRASASGLPDLPKLLEHVRIHCDGDLVVEQQQCRVIVNSDGWSFPVPEEPCTDLPSGATVKMELASRSGLMRFSTKVVHTEFTPPIEVDGKTVRRRLLVVERPKAMDSRNRRRLFRVQTNIDAKIQAPGSEREIASGKVQDMSIGGCSANVDVPLVVGDTVTVALLLDDDPLLLPAECKRLIRTGPSGMGGLYGFRFRSLDHPTSRRLSALVLDLERGVVSEDGLSFDSLRGDETDEYSVRSYSTWQSTGRKRKRGN